MASFYEGSSVGCSRVPQVHFVRKHFVRKQTMCKSLYTYLTICFAFEKPRWLLHNTADRAETVFSHLKCQKKRVYYKGYVALYYLVRSLTSTASSSPRLQVVDVVEIDKLAGEIHANAPRLGEHAFRVLILSHVRVAWSISLSRAQCISPARSSLSEN